MRFILAALLTLSLLLMNTPAEACGTRLAPGSGPKTSIVYAEKSGRSFYVEFDNGSIWFYQKCHHRTQHGCYVWPRYSSVPGVRLKNRTLWAPDIAG